MIRIMLGFRFCLFFSRWQEGMLSEIMPNPVAFRKFRRVYSVNFILVFLAPIEAEFYEHSNGRISSLINLAYSRVEVAVDARRLGSGFVVKKCSVQNVILSLIMRIKPDPGCGRLPRLGRNKADAVRSARPKSKRCRHILSE